MKPANAKAWALLSKLERLADPAHNGTPHERELAQRKLQRLKSRFDFATPPPADTMDIFASIKVKRTRQPTTHLCTFESDDYDVANSVKWAIENATGVACLFRGGALHGAVTPGTARKLAHVALHIALSFETLLQQFGRVSGVTATDRSLFVRGLYDGMMNDARGAGEPLPGAVRFRVKRIKARKGAVSQAPGLAIHPYTLALDLGKQIRFAAPLEEITAELKRATAGALSKTASFPRQAQACPNRVAADARRRTLQ